MDIIDCEECGLKFTMKKNLYVHVRKIHKREVILTKDSKELCDLCGEQFYNYANLIRHKKNIHGVEATTRNSRFLCPVENCLINSETHNSSINHLMSFHKIPIEFKEMKFESQSAFLAWKNGIQEHEFTSYVLDSASKTLRDGNKKEYYSCHRSYKYEGKGKGLRNMKGTGSNKIGKSCPSRMEVVYTELEISVKYWVTHIGHTIDLGRVFLNRETRAIIAGKIKEGVTFEHILDDIRDKASTSEERGRILLLERKDIHNIVRDYHIDYGTKRHENDAISIKLWVKEMEALGEDCPVLFFKEQGVACATNLLHINDFVLIIMTSFQAQQLKQFGNDRICIDGTHGTNAYDFQLFTVMTVDEFGSGSPVAFCFSNRADETIFNIYFETIKSKIGLISANIFMSDDAPAFYNAWHKVMQPVPHRLLCTWHVDKNWRQNLSKVSGGTEKKALVYKSLRILLQLTSVNDFQRCLNNVLNDLFTDPDTINFGIYFKDHYACRPQCWAYCYRTGLGINTNMYLESLHKVLKHIYLGGKNVRRLDKSVNAVMKIARDSLFKRLIKLAKQSPTEKSKKIRESHLAAQTISLESFTQLENKDEYTVTSADKFKRYLVQKTENICSENCMRCTSCNICLHSFKCSCVDNLIKLNICKHIHACCMFFYRSDVELQILNNNTAIDEVLLELPGPSHSSNQRENEIAEIKNRAELVLGLCNSSSLSNEEHKEVISHLDKAISLLNKKNNFIATEKINCNKKVDQQLRLFSTKKKRFQTTLQTASSKERQELESRLLQ